MLTEDIFQHYEIDAGDIEKLIEMWKFFNKKDDPQPIDTCRVNLNKKYPDVTYYQVMFALAQSVFNVYWRSRFYCCCFDIRIQDHVDFMYKNFIEYHNAPEKKERPSHITDDVENPTKSKPTKEKAARPTKKK